MNGMIFVVPGPERDNGNNFLDWLTVHAIRKYFPEELVRLSLRLMVVWIRRSGWRLARFQVKREDGASKANNLKEAAKACGLPWAVSSRLRSW
jgi:hypothetical protein